jgi:DNA-directed RNA polymerase specialized sigma24 family protein
VAEISYADVNMIEVFERLTLHAYTLFGCFPYENFEPVMRGLGDSPGDLASEVMTKLLDPENRSVQWSPSKGKPTMAGLVRYLKEVLTNDFFDRRRDKRYTTRADLPPVETDDEKGMTLDQLAIELETPEAIARRHECYDRLRARLAGEPDLRDLLDIQLEPDAYLAYTNKEAADVLGTTVDDIENRKKRLQRRLLRYRDEGTAAAGEK